MNKEQQDIQQEISLLDLWHIFIRHIWFIILITAIFFIAAVSYAWFIVTPDYISNADVMVQIEQDSGTTADPNYDLLNAFRLIDTVAELMEKDVILENTLLRLEAMGYTDLTISDLRSGLSVTSSSTSYFINISFVDTDTELARTAVDAVIEAVIEETDTPDAFPVLTDKIRRTSMASEARYNSPNKVLFAAIGFVLGGIVSVGIVFTKEMLSTHFRSKDEVEAVLNLQVLGVIPKMEYKETVNGKK
ncbi:MAG: YveK family protein [Acholeplasmataceae bacterium]